MHYTIPPEEQMVAYEARTPKYMLPNRTPFIAVYEGALNDDECQRVLYEASKIKAHKYEGCGGLTTELEMNDPCTLSTKECLLRANQDYFQCDIGGDTVGYVQEYTAGDEYALHMDGGPGQSRKLTALVILSAEHEYTGGSLWFHLTPVWWEAPRTRGTVLVFPFWLNHQVQKIGSGIRHSLNLGAWGPEWR